MRYFVLGAGLAGREIARVLHEQGHEVIGSTTTPAKVDTGSTTTPDPNVRSAGGPHGTARDAAAVGQVRPRRRPSNPAHRPGKPAPAPTSETFETVSIPRRAPLQTPAGADDDEPVRRPLDSTPASQA